MTILLVRRGFLGPILLYAQSIFVLPLSALSYIYFSEHLDYRLVETSFSAQEVIYIFLPLVFAHSILSIKKARIPIEIFSFFILLASAQLFLWFINRLLV
jgi:hypothetical protein